jgi:hypothetical protein
MGVNTCRYRGIVPIIRIEVGFHPDIRKKQLEKKRRSPGQDSVTPQKDLILWWGINPRNYILVPKPAGLEKSWHSWRGY